MEKKESTPTMSSLETMGATGSRVSSHSVPSPILLPKLEQWSNQATKELLGFMIRQFTPHVWQQVELVDQFQLSNTSICFLDKLQGSPLLSVVGQFLTFTEVSKLVQCSRWIQQALYKHGVPGMVLRLDLYSAGVIKKKMDKVLNDSNGTRGLEAVSLPRLFVWDKVENLSIHAMSHSIERPVVNLLVQNMPRLKRLYLLDPDQGIGCQEIIALSLQYPHLELYLKGFWETEDLLVHPEVGPRIRRAGVNQDLVTRPRSFLGNVNHLTVNHYRSDILPVPSKEKLERIQFFQGLRNLVSIKSERWGASVHPQEGWVEAFGHTPNLQSLEIPVRFSNSSTSHDLILTGLRLICLKLDLTFDSGWKDEENVETPCPRLIGERPYSSPESKIEPETDTLKALKLDLTRLVCLEKFVLCTELLPSIRAAEKLAFIDLAWYNRRDQYMTIPPPATWNVQAPGWKTFKGCSSQSFRRAHPCVRFLSNEDFY